MKQAPTVAKATKTSRKEEGTLYSTVMMGEQKFLLLSGKDRFVNELPVPSTFLGRGARGKVKQALKLNTTNEAPVAVKIFSKVNIKPAVQEAKILQTLGVPICIGETDTKVYLFKNLEKGITLKQFFDSLSAPISSELEDPIFASKSCEQGIIIFKHLVNALFGLHKKGVNHLDLHFANALWDESTSTVTIIDFDRSREKVALEPYDQMPLAFPTTYLPSLDLKDYLQDLIHICKHFKNTCLFEKSFKRKLLPNVEQVIQALEDYLDGMIGNPGKLNYLPLRKEFTDKLDDLCLRIDACFQEIESSSSIDFDSIDWPEVPRK
ncbi:MAG: hypothetical protein AB7V32_08275 [Candidatus Berkiella sp.]